MECYFCGYDGIPETNEAIVKCPVCNKKIVSFEEKDLEEENE